MTDRELLERFVDGESSALEELVRRHAGWIYRVAQRQLRNAALAEDAAQAIFLVLIRKAHSLPASTPLAAWLHRVTIFTTREIARQEARRKRREETAAMMRQEQISPEENAWVDMAPLLESLVHRLGKSDRQAILLRFYGQRDFADVAAELQTTESAARKRVERAIHKLRQLFAAQNIHQSSDLLGATLLTHSGGLVGTEVMARITANIASQRAGEISTVVLRRLHHVRIGLLGTMVGAALITIVSAATIRSVTSHPVHAAILSGAAATAPVDVPASITFEQFINHLQTAETQIKNLHMVHFVTTEQRRASQKDPWQSTPGTFEGSAWFDRAGHGRVRINLTHWNQEMTEQNAGRKTSWIDNPMDFGFDGQQSRLAIYYHVTKRDGIKIGIRPSVDIYPGLYGLVRTVESPSQVWTLGANENAVMITQNPSAPSKHETLSSIFLRLHRKGVLWQAYQTNIQDRIAIKVVMNGPYARDSLRITCWFDPSRDYTLLQEEEFFGFPGGDRRLVHVTKLKQAAPGIWFPMDAIFEEDSQPWFYRYTYHVDDVVANDPKFDRTDFLPPLAVGEDVVDHRSTPPKEYHFSDDSGIP